MNNKIILSIAIVALIVGVIGVFNSGVSVSTLNNEMANFAKNLGAFAGPDIKSEYLIFKGIEHRYYSSGFNQASTTVCMFKTPSATSTLVAASVKSTTGTTTVTSLEIGKSTLQSATTTRLVYVPSIGSDGLITVNTFVASTTGSGTTNALVDGYTNALFTATQNDLVFAPSTYLNVKMGGTKGDDNVYVGKCKAEFIVN